MRIREKLRRRQRHRQSETTSRQTDETSIRLDDLTPSQTTSTLLYIRQFVPVINSRELQLREKIGKVCWCIRILVEPDYFFRSRSPFCYHYSDSDIRIRFLSTEFAFYRQNPVFDVRIPWNFSIKKVKLDLYRLNPVSIDRIRFL
jgi:hypothetical protein